MPLKMIEPEVYLHYKDTTIYHAYKNDNPEVPMSRSFTTDIHEDGEFEFCLDDFTFPDYIAEGPTQLQVRFCVENGLLPMPDEAAALEPITVKSEMYSDDHSHHALFDASLWLLKAPISQLAELIKCGYSKGVGADSVGLWASREFPSAAKLMAYLYSANLDEDHSGFEVSVDKEAAVTFLLKHRNEDYWKAMASLGLVVKVDATVSELVERVQSVSTYVEVDADIASVDLDDLPINNLEFNESAEKSVIEMIDEEQWKVKALKSNKEIAYTLLSVT